MSMKHLKAIQFLSCTYKWLHAKITANIPPINTITNLPDLNKRSILRSLFRSNTELCKNIKLISKIIVSKGIQRRFRRHTRRTWTSSHFQFRDEIVQVFPLRSAKVNDNSHLPILTFSTNSFLTFLTSIVARNLANIRNASMSRKCLVFCYRSS